MSATTKSELTLKLTHSLEPEVSLTLTTEMLDIILTALDRAHFREVAISVELGTTASNRFRWMRDKIIEAKVQP